jgi:hypothetical protein
MEQPVIKSISATTMQVNSHEFSFPTQIPVYFEAVIYFSPELEITIKLDQWKSQEDIIRQAKELMAKSSAS